MSDAVEVKAVQRWCGMWKTEIGQWVYVADGLRPLIFCTEAEALEAAKAGPENPVSF